MLERDLQNQELMFPLGILGFPLSKRFQLERYRSEDGSDSPFLTLKCLDDDLSFAVIDPGYVGLDYRVAVPGEVFEMLRAPSVNHLSALLIVTLRERIEEVTVNLQGPLIVNSTTALALQLVVEDYPVRFPLLRNRTD